jgi:hypothetical protein
MLPFDFIAFRESVNLIDWVRDMLSLSGNLTFATTTFSYISRPWEWILHLEAMPYWYQPHYIGVISFTIWILIIPSVLYMLFRAVKGCNASIFGVSWFVGSYLLWIPISLITDRISFVYYFYPTVGAICIGLGLGLARLINIWETKSAGKFSWIPILTVPVYLSLHIGVFIILSPLSIWGTVPFLE